MKDAVTDSLGNSISIGGSVDQEQNKQQHVQSDFIVCISISNTNAIDKPTLGLNRRKKLKSLPYTQHNSITTIIGYVFDLKSSEFSGFNITVIVCNNEYQLKHISLNNTCDLDCDVLSSFTNDIMDTIDDTYVHLFSPTATGVSSREFDNLACDLHVVSPALAIAAIVTIENGNEIKYKDTSNYFKFEFFKIQITRFGYIFVCDSPNTTFLFGNQR